MRRVRTRAARADEIKFDSVVALRKHDGGTQQALTDSGTITITNFVVTPSNQIAPMSGYCKITCTVNCPRVIVREFEVVLRGISPSDPTIQRQLRSNVRVRNDYYDGQCPTS